MAYQENPYPERLADAQYPNFGSQETLYQAEQDRASDQRRGDAERQNRDWGSQERRYSDTQYRGWEYQEPGYQARQAQNRSSYMQRDRHDTSPEQGSVQDILLGLLGGVAGVIAMDIFSQQIMPLLSQDSEGEESGGQENNQEQPLDSISLVGTQHRPKESATAALGRMLYHWATDEDPAKKTKTTLSYAVHWGYGIGQGGVYAAARGPVEGFDLAGGLAFGTGLWLFGDEMAVPMLGLQGGPTASGVSNHLNRLTMHLVYGVTTAATTQWLRRLV